MASDFHMPKVQERFGGGLAGTAAALLCGVLAGLGALASGIATVPGALMIGILICALILLWQRVSAMEKRLGSRRNQEEDLVAFEASVNERLLGFQNKLADEREGIQSLLAQSNGRVEGFKGELEHFDRKIEAMDEEVLRLSDRISPSGVPIPPEDAASAQIPAISVVPEPAQAVNMKSAVANDGLSMHLQPIVEIAERKPTLYEAFMRVRSTRGQYLDQTEFQKMAAQGGLMPTINKKVLFSSLRMLRRLGEKKMRAGVLSQIAGQSLSDTKGFQ
ncbi:MAG: EAL domain-containing protein, partial [Pseudomonadota bacterium]